MTTARRRDWPAHWSGHAVHTAQSRGWGTLSNGELLNAAEEAGFDLLLTTDRRIRYQQNLKVRRLALVVLTGSTSGPPFGNTRIGSLRPFHPRRPAATPRLKSRWSRNEDVAERWLFVPSAENGQRAGSSRAWFDSRLRVTVSSTASD